MASDAPDVYRLGPNLGCGLAQKPSLGFWGWY
jgi:hypothetical protein